MPNIEGIGLQNFRTFNKKEELEFAPITLITGTNNAGKSSVFKAIQFMVHNFKNGIDSESLDFKTMKHELGNLERIFNRDAMETLKKSNKSNGQHMYSRLADFYKINDNLPVELPIFEENEDLVFSFPVKLGGSREISATLEVRYGLRLIHKTGYKEDLTVSHDIKNIAIIWNGEYLHWSNIIGYMEPYDDSPYWEMETCINLKKIIQLIRETPFVEKSEGFEPNEKTEEYFTIDLYRRIEKYKHTYFDFPFFKKEKDGYEGFTEKFIQGKSLFSDYSELTEEEKSELLAIEQKITTKLLKGKNNSQSKVLECFKQPFSNIFDGMERDIVSEELKNKQTEEKQKNSDKQKLRDHFTSPMFQTTPNSVLFTNLLGAIEKDFLNTVQNKIDSLKKVYFLPTTRGRNREWFIDEQNSEDIQIVRDFSAIYLEHHPQIKEFVNFWIGKGEINDENGEKKHKGFKIGKELLVYRDEAIGLTKIFLVNFDDSKTPLVDLGYGVSQLLPIIMKIAIIAQNNQKVYDYDFNNQEGYYEKQTIYFTPSTLLIEEPEANLHPSLQSKIAELIIDAASRFNIQFLIETHSEYLIYKFQEYIGKKIVSSDDVKMFYFNHPEDVRQGIKNEYISKVQINKDGSIDYEKYFGKGFFDEQTNLKLSLLNIQRARFLDDFDKLKLQNEQNDNKIAVLGQKIDDYINKLDIQFYQTIINSRFDVSKISPISSKYLSSGQLLLNTIDLTSDFSPVIIQYGRAIENELKEIFIAIGISDVKKLMLGKFQGSLEKYKTGTTNQSPLSNNELIQLPTEMTNRFTNPYSLKIELLEDIRVGRNESGHSGHTKTKQDAIEYIDKVNEFLDKWISEKK